MTSGTTQDFRFRDILLVAYGPSVVSAIGHGAMLPVLALRARDLGADVSVAAAIVALLGVGQLLASLPAGALVARIGERRALVGAGLVDACAMAFAALTDSVLGLAIGVLLSGVCWTLFLIARQGFMIDVVPESHRARAMSLLGGSYRVGVLIGPLIGAGLIAVSDLDERLLAGRRDVRRSPPCSRPRCPTSARRSAPPPGRPATWACGP